MNQNPTGRVALATLVHLCTGLEPSSRSSPMFWEALIKANEPRRLEELRARLQLHYPNSFELFFAIHEGTTEDVENRLQAGDDPNATSVDGRTPLCMAVRFEKDLPKASLLLAAGARIDPWDDFGLQPIHWVSDDVGSLRWLLDRGANVNAAVQNGPRGFYPRGWSALHIAANKNSLTAVEFLISRGANPNIKAADGGTTLHAALSPRSRFYKRLVRELLDAGADLHLKNDVGHTPFQLLLAGSGKYRGIVIKLLRSRGATE